MLFFHKRNHIIFLLFLFSCKKEIPPVKHPTYEVFERSIINKGDELRIYGGNNSYLKDSLGCDTCIIIIDKFFSQKLKGNHAFFYLKNQKKSSNLFSIKLYYWNNKRGYEKGNIILWKEDPSLIEFDDWMNFNVPYEIIEEGIHFQKPP